MKQRLQDTSLIIRTVAWFPLDVAVHQPSDGWRTAVHVLLHLVCQLVEVHHHVLLLINGCEWYARASPGVVFCLRIWGPHLRDY